MIQLSADNQALLAEIMRERARKIDEEIARLQAERRDIEAWLAEHEHQA